MWLSDSKQTLMMGAAVHCVESILQIRWVKNVVVQCSVCTERGTEAITDLSSQAARIAHKGNILFMAALDAINPPPTVAPISSPNSSPLLASTPLSSTGSSPSRPHLGPHPAAPTGTDSSQTSEQLRNELWRLSLEYSEYIVDEVFKPQIMELLSTGGDGFDSRSGPGIIIRALDYVQAGHHNQDSGLCAERMALGFKAGTHDGCCRALWGEHSPNTVGKERCGPVLSVYGEGPRINRGRT